MKILKKRSCLLVALSAIFIHIFFVNLANAISLIYFYRGVNDRPNGAAHVRRNGATLKWQN